MSTKTELYHSNRVRIYYRAVALECADVSMFLITVCVCGTEACHKLTVTLWQ